MHYQPLYSKVLVTQSRWILCDPMDCSLPDSSVQGISQARILEYSFSNSYSAAKSLQSCPTLCDPMDCSLPGFSVHGILQVRTLEWVAISFSNAWKWSHSVVSDSLRPHGLQPTRLLHPWDFLGKSTGVGCHCLLPIHTLGSIKLINMTISPTVWCEQTGI